MSSRILLMLTLCIVAAPAWAVRSVDVVDIETGDGLDDNIGESHTFKCSILNPSTKPQAITFSWWSKANTPGNKITLPPVSTPTGTYSITLNENESYTLFFCLAKSATDCEEASRNTMPIRLNISVANNDGWLVGSCVTHFSDNANKHRSSSTLIAGGRPF